MSLADIAQSLPAPSRPRAGEDGRSTEGLHSEPHIDLPPPAARDQAARLLLRLRSSTQPLLPRSAPIDAATRTSGRSCTSPA